MTAIGITVTTAVPSGTRLRLTVRGRRVLATLAALPAVVALGAAIVSGGAALGARDAVPETSFYSVTVAPGDSLWSIAEAIAPSADPRDVVDAIVRLNALGDVTVTPGQDLAIPAQYSPAR